MRAGSRRLPARPGTTYDYGCVCYPHMAKGGWAATTEFKVNLLAPVTGGKLEAVVPRKAR